MSDPKIVKAAEILGKAFNTGTINCDDAHSLVSVLLDVMPFPPKIECDLWWGGWVAALLLGKADIRKHMEA